MHALTRRNLTRFAAALGLLAGSSGALAECFSQTIAEETYYACSGVLTVAPAEGADTAETGEKRAPDTGAEVAPKNLPDTGTRSPDTKNGPP